MHSRTYSHTMPATTRAPTSLRWSPSESTWYLIIASSSPSSSSPRATRRRRVPYHDVARASRRASSPRAAPPPPADRTVGRQRKNRTRVVIVSKCDPSEQDTETAALALLSDTWPIAPAGCGRHAPSWACHGRGARVRPTREAASWRAWRRHRGARGGGMVAAWWPRGKSAAWRESDVRSERHMKRERHMERERHVERERRGERATWEESDT